MAIPTWQKALVATHRWVGIAGGLLFVAWFASGIVMMYRRMPALEPAERMARLPPLDATAVRTHPEEAAAALGLSDQAAAGGRLGMHDGRPVYRFGGAGAVWADAGRPVDPLTAEGALAVAVRFAPEHANTALHVGRLEAPDQWTLQSRAYLPLHRVALDDPEGTELYVAERTADVVMETTRSERRWAYAGAVLHWLYFTPFRTHSALWAQTIIWLSIAGCLLTLTGLLWGVLRYSRGSPYAGLLRWHHYSGLVFGLFTFTWTLSGGLSMDPWSWHPGTAPTRAQRDAVAGVAPPMDGETVEAIRGASVALADAWEASSEAPRAPTPASVKELGFFTFLGERHAIAYGHAAPPGTPHLVRLAAGARPFERFVGEDMQDAARAAMPGVPIAEERWLDAYDAYHYARGAHDGAGPALPVLRVRFSDEQETWLYLDPARGTIVRKEERLTRMNRWLYQGLHSLDFPGFYERRPLWDLVVIALSLGGIVLAATTLLPGWRRLRRALERRG